MIGTRLAHYQITAHLGSGGMGEVYQATDAKLGRNVAIKLLPEAFTGDAERVARFEREARVLASLNHPNIAGIHGLGESGGRKFLVMELVPGETLAERIKRGPIPVEEALGFAKEIAEALEAAHNSERGIIHRDLKPANVKITPDGKVKVLDFGLAKAYAGEAPDAGLSNSPTLSMAATNAGMILGTAAYMSPEQAKGQALDRRTDLFSFGVVLYEMLTGRQAFPGDTVTEILAGVIKVDPDWNRLPQDTPLGIRRLLRRCLQKDRNRRLRDIGDARIEIEEARNESQPVEASSGPKGRERLLLLSALALVTLVAAILGAVALRPARVAPTAPELRLDITTPPTTVPSSLAISPDGQKIVFVATDEGASRRLWLRLLNSASAQPLKGTDGSAYPFWSPDSRSIGFFAEGKLKRIDIDRGIVQTLANAGAARGGAWAGDGTIIFAPTSGGQLFRVAATGGEAKALTLDAEQGGHIFPGFLSDGRHFLYYLAAGAPGVPGVYVSQLDRQGTRRLFNSDSTAVTTSSGQLLFTRQGTLFAQTFDESRLELTGNPFPVAERLNSVLAGDEPVSASAAGPIAYRAGPRADDHQFIWVDRSGKEIGKVGEPDRSSPEAPSLSPDGGHVVLQRRNLDPRSNSIWLLDTGNGQLTRFTFGPGTAQVPLWFQDGSRIVFQTRGALYVKSATGAGPEELLLASDQIKSPTDWSSDGRFLLFRSLDPKNNYDIWALPMFGERKPFPVVQTSAEERDGQFSPDGKWIAYQSNETGRFEIYVQPFPGPGGKYQISTNGGAQVRWRRDGKELFYIALDGRMMAVPIQFTSNSQAIEAGTPVPLFATRVGDAISFRQEYMVSPDGQRFLMNSIIEEPASPITVILNWKGKP